MTPRLPPLSALLALTAGAGTRGPDGLWTADAPGGTAGGACGAQQGQDAARRAAGTMRESQTLGRSWEAWRWPWNP